MASNPPVVNDILEIKSVAFLNNQVGINVTHWLVSNVTAGGATMQQIADDISPAIGAALKPLMTNGASFRGTTVQGIFPLPKVVPAVSILGQGPGTAGTSPLPGQVSGIITLTTPFAGRAMRGRVYIPFPDDADSGTDGTPLNGYVTRLNTLGDVYANGRTVVAGAATTLIVPCIYHRRAPASVTRPVSRLGRKAWATQRRRGDYGKTNPMPF